MEKKYSTIDALLGDLKINKDYMKCKWGMRYINTLPNNNIVFLINNSNKDNPINVLEIGCDLGATLLAIKNKYPNATTYGIEIDSNATSIAKHVVDYVYTYNIETNDNIPLEIDKNIFNNSFDYIIFGDVLEHLRDPEVVLRKCRKILKPEGHIIASIPNLMHISVMKQLINGNFTYTETGLLDKTHIHLFTKKEICTMFKNAGYKFDNISSLSQVISQEDNKLIASLLTLANNNSGVTRDMYTTFQYLCVASKQ